MLGSEAEGKRDVFHADGAPTMSAGELLGLGENRVGSVNPALY